MEYLGREDGVARVKLSGVVLQRALKILTQIFNRKISRFNLNPTFSPKFLTLKVAKCCTNDFNGDLRTASIPRAKPQTP